MTGWVAFSSFRAQYVGSGAEIIQGSFALFFTLYFFGMPALWIRRNRPVSINDDGVCSYLFGRPWVSLTWAAVREIKKVHIGKKWRGGADDLYVLKGSHGAVYISDMMIDGGKLIEAMLAGAQKHNITIVGSR
jgi:hypothetical protein